MSQDRAAPPKGLPPEASPASWGFPNLATPLGSSTYYSLRFSPPPLRDDLAILAAWRHQVRAILEDVSDSGVARLKLQWWREEAGRLDKGKPSHPLSQALQPLVARHRFVRPQRVNRVLGLPMYYAAQLLLASLI